MDFFSAQDDALRRSKRLIYLFILAVAAIVMGVYLAVASFVLLDGTGGGSLWNPVLFAWVAIPITLVIAIASAVKISQYKQGGGVVAKALGGRLVDPATQDAKERQLMNIVEEMSIASGMPVPEVYILDNESGVNAFAAGYSQHDAAVAVTQGALEGFTRDELQGVMAHEFSHIHNGDMRLNIRTAGVIFGIFLLSVIGHGMIRGGMRAAFVSGGSRRGGKNNGGGAMLAIVALGIALYLFGLIGQLFGRLIQAAVSRQREFLADAAAVQFTRNPDGIANALKRIAHHTSGGKIETEAAQGLAHFFFASALSKRRGSLFATHPPLQKRIRAIEPNWDGSPAPALRTQTASPKPAEKKKAQAPQKHSASTFTGPQKSQLIMASSPSEALGLNHGNAALTLDLARLTLAAMPIEVRIAGHCPKGAFALACALLLSKDTEVRKQQNSFLLQSLKQPFKEAYNDVLPMIDTLKEDQRLPALSLALPALHALESRDVDVLISLCRRLIAADNKVSAFEWCLLQMLRRHFKLRDPQSEDPHASLTAQDQSAALSLIALVFVLDPPEKSSQKAVWQQTLSSLKLDLDTPLPDAGKPCFEDRLEAELDQLAQAPAAYRKLFLQTAEALMSANGIFIPEEKLTLKSLAFCLDCPVG